MLDGIFTGLSSAVMPFNLMMVVVGCFAGTFIGMLPGLGPISAVALMPTLKELGYDATFVNWRGFFAAPGVSESQKAEFVSVLEKMYQTDEWETVRARNGWAEIFKPDAQFISFLEQQEKDVGDLMRELGFLK